MAVDLLLFALVGCCLGIVTGLIPGLHVNTIALIALEAKNLGNLNLVVLIACMSVVHSFVDFIPSILFGAPENDTFLSVLPGHRLLLDGKGLVAVKLTIAGGLFAGILALLLAPAFVLFLEKGNVFLSAIVPLVLAAVLIAMVLEERNKKMAALLVVILSGMLGMLALKSRLPLHQPLFCLATGFFAASTLIDSILKKQAFAEQESQGFFVERTAVAKNGLLALLAGSFVSLFPGIGPSQAAFVVRKAVGKIGPRDYLVLLGGINTVTMILSFFVLFAWGKTRTGAAVAVSQLVEFGLREAMLVAAALLVALGFAAIATDLIAGKALKLMAGFDYKKLNFGVLAFVTALVFAFSGVLGLVFYAIAALIGIGSLNLGVKRANNMAFLMVPTLAFYAGFV